MIPIISISNNNKKRTFGWIQDSTDFISLRKVVEVFLSNSETYNSLINEKINLLVEERDGREYFLKVLKQIPIELKYRDLVGSAFTPRSSARCNGIIQATVKGQKRPFLTDWASDNFIRWAHALGFIEYNYENDSFKITSIGEIYASSKKNKDGTISQEEKEILIKAILSYPPAVRVLKLLSTGEHLTKYEMGSNFGFIGEDGFTSLPQNILLRTLAQSEPSEKNKIKTDWDGSCDKYIRTICSWLAKLDLIKQEPKYFEITILSEIKRESIGHSYIITNEGLKALRKSIGQSSSSRAKKNIWWEMLCTKGSDRNYIRTRRSLLLKILIEKKKAINIIQMSKFLKEYKIESSASTIENDLEGLIRLGIMIKKIDKHTYILEDKINDFIIPVFKKDSSYTISELTRLKDSLRCSLTHIPHDYLNLIDLGFDNKQNRLFEMKVMELLISECNFEGTHLGNSRKPDGVAYTIELDRNYGIIIDTKAYKNGYTLPISQADEMARYINENKKRDKNENKNEWWLTFPENIDDFGYLFVSGAFKGKTNEQLLRLSSHCDTKGGAIDIPNLLILAENIKSNKYNKLDVKSQIFNNSICCIS